MSLNTHIPMDFFEDINNKIKIIKRVTYGYRDFLNFKHFVSIIQNETFQIALKK